MPTSSTLKLALELAAKVTGREDLAALAGQVQELGPLSDETAAETERLEQTLEGLTQQRDLIAQFEASGRALSPLEQATVLSRDKLAELRREQQQTGGGARQLTDQDRLLVAEVKQLERQLVAQVASHSRLHAGLSQAGLDTRNKPGCSGSCVRARPRPSGWGAPWCRGHKAPAASRAVSAA